MTEKTLRTIHVASLASTLLVSACGASDDPCGSGDSTRYEGESYCLYRAAITEEGFMCPAGLPQRFDFDGFTACADMEALPDGFEEHARRELGSGDAGASDASMVADGETGSCWDGWEMPATRVTAPRPDPSSSPALRLQFSYGTSEGRGEIVLDDMAGETVVGTEDGPFMAGVHSGSWVELRDATDATLYTRGVHTLIPESLEAPGPDGGFTNVETCPEPGVIRLTNMSNDSAATHVVFFGEPLDGTVTSEASRELARFALP